jgi:hypothetical protein
MGMIGMVNNKLRHDVKWLLMQSSQQQQHSSTSPSLSRSGLSSPSSSSSSSIVWREIFYHTLNEAIHFETALRTVHSFQPTNSSSSALPQQHHKRKSFSAFILEEEEENDVIHPGSSKGTFSSFSESTLEVFTEDQKVLQLWLQTETDCMYIHIHSSVAGSCLTLFS